MVGGLGGSDALDVVPVSQAGIALETGPTVEHDCRKAGDLPPLHLGNEVVRERLPLVPPRPYLHGEGAAQRPRDLQQTILQLLLPQHQRRPCPLVANHVNGATQVQIHKVGLDLLLQHLRNPRELIWEAAGDLYPEHVLIRVALQQCPLSRVSRQKLGGHGHFAAGDVGAKLLHDAAEGEVADGREGGDVDLVAEVDELALLAGEGGQVHGIGGRRGGVLVVGRSRIQSRSLCCVFSVGSFDGAVAHLGVIAGFVLGLLFWFRCHGLFHLRISSILRLRCL
mmetsp:Transcript_16149/g.33144  ORF Transcript_16149/g.33144 Transcript_16149/m.33144 type:complete len:281 (+) Transcript_16149:652-1494(+)